MWPLQSNSNTLVLASRVSSCVRPTISALLFTWAVAVPFGIYTAVRQYSFGDYALTTIGLIGLATPNFLLALILMYIGYEWFGVSIGGLFSMEYQEAPWSCGGLPLAPLCTWATMQKPSSGSS